MPADEEINRSFQDIFNENNLQEVADAVSNVSFNRLLETASALSQSILFIHEYIREFYAVEEDLPTEEEESEDSEHEEIEVAVRLTAEQVTILENLLFYADSFCDSIDVPYIIIEDSEDDGNDE